MAGLIRVKDEPLRLPGADNIVIENCVFVQGGDPALRGRRRLVRLAALLGVRPVVVHPDGPMLRIGAAVDEEAR
jgi:hypothetical protein